MGGANHIPGQDKIPDYRSRYGRFRLRAAWSCGFGRVKVIWRIRSHSHVPWAALDDWAAAPGYTYVLPTIAA